MTGDDLDSLDLFNVVRPPPPRRSVARGNCARRLKTRGDDIYETPPEAVEALLRVEKLTRHVWEPSCGPHDRVGAVLRAHGHEVTSSDLVPDRIDFLMEWRRPDGVEAIVTNPPFKLGNQLIRHGLALVCRSSRCCST